MVETKTKPENHDIAVIKGCSIIPMALGRVGGKKEDHCFKDDTETNKYDLENYITSVLHRNEIKSYSPITLLRDGFWASTNGNLFY